MPFVQYPSDILSSSIQHIKTRPFRFLYYYFLLEARLPYTLDLSDSFDVLLKLRTAFLEAWPKFRQCFSTLATSRYVDLKRIPKFPTQQNIYVRFLFPCCHDAGPPRGNHVKRFGGTKVERSLILEQERKVNVEWVDVCFLACH